MPREEICCGDRDAFDDYEKAYECRLSMENRMLHLQGLYNYQAFGSVLSQAFSGSGGNKVKYFDYPIPITEAEKKAEKERKIKRTLQWVRSRNKDG